MFITSGEKKMKNESLEIKVSIIIKHSSGCFVK